MAASSSAMVIPELERLKKAIKDVLIETFDQVLDIFLSLKESMFNHSPQLLQKPDCASIPNHFHKPASMQTMKDAAILVRGLVDALKMSIKVLRLLIEQTPSNNLSAGNRTVICQLLTPLLKVYDYLQPDLQDVLATIMNITIRDDNCKMMVGKSPDAITLLIKALGTGNVDTSTQAIKVIYALSTVNYNNLRLGKLGVIEALVHALEDNEVAEKDVYDVLFKLCEMLSNRMRVLQVILEAMMGQKFGGRMLLFLNRLSYLLDARFLMIRLGALRCLLDIIKVSTHPSYQDISAAILYMIGTRYRYTLREINEEEEAEHTISQLAEDGTKWGQEMAQDILKMLKT